MDDSRNSARFRHEQAFDQRVGVVIAIAHGSRQNRGGGRDEDSRGVKEMMSSRRLHDLTFRPSPAVVGREDRDGQPLDDRGQLLRPPITPQGGSRREAELGPAAPCFPLPGRQPLSKTGTRKSCVS